MSEMQNFRSALGGFNREDVVRYIEYINNKHSAELAQLNTQLQTAREALSQVKAQGDINEVKAQLEAAQARCAQLEAAQARCTELEAELAAAKAAQPVAAPVVQEKTFDELEAYRRAERAERIAQERSQMICDQANAALADAGAKVNSAAGAIDEAAKGLDTQLEAYMIAVDNAKATLHEASAALAAIAPVTE